MSVETVEKVARAKTICDEAFEAYCAKQERHVDGNTAADRRAAEIERDDDAKEAMWDALYRLEPSDVAALAAMGEREDLSGYTSDRVFDGVRALPRETASAHVERVKRAMSEREAVAYRWRCTEGSEHNQRWRVCETLPVLDGLRGYDVQPLYASPRPEAVE